MAKHDEYPRVEVTSRRAWRAWLARHHRRADGVWLVTYKLGASRPRVPWSEIVDEALCFGWIDSVRRKLDLERTMLLVTPRRPRSAWSEINKNKVERLLAEGWMTPVGLAKVEAAKRDRSWSKLEKVDLAGALEDLLAALRPVARAHEHWKAFPPGVRRLTVHWVASAKRPETRAKRIAEAVRLAARNQRASDWPRPSSRPRAARRRQE